MNGDDRGLPRTRILASVSLIFFTAGLAAAAWHATGGDVATAQSGLFGQPIVDLELDGDRRVDAFVGHTNLAPGDHAPGTLRLYSHTALPRDTHDLDFAVEGTLEGHADDGPRLDDALRFHRLAYGRDDLLRGEDGGRNLTAELDASGDGRLSVRELAAGANDLPPPVFREAGGTPLVVHLRFEPGAGTGGTDYRGQQLRLTFHFHLADALEPDLR